MMDDNFQANSTSFPHDHPFISVILRPYSFSYLRLGEPRGTSWLGMVDMFLQVSAEPDVPVCTFKIVVMYFSGEDHPC